MPRNSVSILRLAASFVLVVAGALILDPVAGSQAAVPGKNGRIAFQSNAGGPAHLAAVNPDGSGLRDLTGPPGQSGLPAWSPDGTRIAFVGATQAGMRLYLLDFFSGDIHTLTSAPGFADSTPAWAPDGAKIAFTRCGGSPEDCDVWVVNVDGSGALNLTQSPGSEDTMPAWAPDGAKIAFSSSRDGNVEIYTMNADGTAPTRLTDAPEADLSPDWSPDGTLLVFARRATFDASAVWTMKADGTEPKELGAGDQPVFSPDGARIAFVKEMDSNRDLWVMNADGSGASALVASQAGESSPSWQPVNAGENAPPVANAGEDATFTCDSAETAARLDGSASSDPDSTPGTSDDIRLFEWWVDFGLATETFLGTGMVKDQLGLPSGTYAVTLQATDSRGQTDTDKVVVTIDDQTPPQVTVVLRPGRIWPPNHRMIRVRADVEALDYCGPATVVLQSVTSSEPENSTGDGNTSPDIKGADLGTADFQFFLRAERSGNGSGRTYTATYAATDPSGNTATASGRSIVPHDQSDKERPGNGDPGTSPGHGWGKGKPKGNGKGNGDDWR